MISEKTKESEKLWVKNGATIGGLDRKAGEKLLAGLIFFVLGVAFSALRTIFEEEWNVGLLVEQLSKRFFGLFFGVELVYIFVLVQGDRLLSLVLGLVADRYSLKLRLPMCILPRDIQHIRTDFACYDFQPSELIALGVGRLSIDPGPVRQDGGLFWQHGLYSVESNMSLRRTSARSFFIFQKDSQNLDGLERFLSRIRQLQQNPWSCVYYSKDKRLL